MPNIAVLENLKEIQRIDKSGMIIHCINASKHYEEAAQSAKIMPLGYSKPKAVIVAGVGGSAISGELVKHWARGKITVPIDVCREYFLPEFAGEETLVFVNSYSGDTEESLSVCLDALKRRCMMICLTSGGALQSFAEKAKIPYVRIPSGIPPRAALPYMFVPTLMILERMGLVSGVESEIDEAINVVKEVSAINSPDKPLKENFCKELAASIYGTVPVIYGFDIYSAVAQRLKQQFNENSKVPSKWEFFPELNHNEIVGWEASKKLTKWFSVIFLRDADEPMVIRERITITKELIRKMSIRTFEIWGVGKGNLAKMASAICLGDFLTVYLAILRGVDPTPVNSIVELKEKMKRAGIRDKVISELQKLMT